MVVCLKKMILCLKRVKQTLKILLFKNSKYVKLVSIEQATLAIHVKLLRTGVSQKPGVPLVLT